jgi:hypothetical protein
MASSQHILFYRKDIKKSIITKKNRHKFTFTAIFIAFKNFIYQSERRLSIGINILSASLILKALYQASI